MWTVRQPTDEHVQRNLHAKTKHRCRPRLSPGRGLSASRWSRGPREWGAQETIRSTRFGQLRLQSIAVPDAAHAVRSTCVFGWGCRPARGRGGETPRYAGATARSDVSHDIARSNGPRATGRWRPPRERSWAGARVLLEGRPAADVTPRRRPRARAPPSPAVNEPSCCSRSFPQPARGTAPSCPQRRVMPLSDHRQSLCTRRSARERPAENRGVPGLGSGTDPIGSRRGICEGYPVVDERQAGRRSPAMRSCRSSYWRRAGRWSRTSRHPLCRPHASLAPAREGLLQPFHTGSPLAIRPDFWFDWSATSDAAIAQSRSRAVCRSRRDAAISAAGSHEVAVPQARASAGACAVPGRARALSGGSGLGSRRHP